MYFLKKQMFCRFTEEEFQAVREQNHVYEDMLKVKDEIIVKLTHEISDIEHHPDLVLEQSDLTLSQSSRDSVLSFKSDKSVPSVDEKEYEKLKVSVYENLPMQNTENFRGVENRKF